LKVSQLLIDAITALGEPLAILPALLEPHRKGRWSSVPCEPSGKKSHDIQLIAIRQLNDTIDVEVRTAEGTFISSGDKVTFVTGRLAGTFVASLEGKIFRSFADTALLASPVNRIEAAWQIANGNFTMLQIAAPRVLFPVLHHHRN
jgi:hypothetical protein